MLWFHIGMPKTGSTALQGYLHSNKAFLQNQKIRYMATGRDRGTGRARLICHNSMATSMARGWVDAPLAEAFHQEYETYEAQHCIVSSEMFFGRDLSSLYSRYLSTMTAPIRFVIYIRQFDEFIEADYKQRAKNGMRTGGADAFVAKRLAQIESDPDYMNFTVIFDRIRQQVPGAEIIPRLYLREEMAGNNVITDFLSLMELPIDDVVLPEAAANKSLSRAASEALGRFEGAGGPLDKKARRQLGRVLQDTADPRIFGKYDVLNTAERKVIMETLEARNADMRRKFFPDRDCLFTPNQSADTPFERGGSHELDDLQYVQRILQDLVDQ